MYAGIILYIPGVSVTIQLAPMYGGIILYIPGVSMTNQLAPVYGGMILYIPGVCITTIQLASTHLPPIGYHFIPVA
jgi:hypothetical protein